MQKCSFCGEIYEFPIGLTYVTADGKIFYYCSSKCRKNTLKLGRDRLKVKWVKNKGVELIQKQSADGAKK